MTEKNNTTNTARSDDSDNSIVLPSTDSTFTYTLTVENSTSAAMSSLVLIDNLPYVGDTYTFNSDVARGSEFAVKLANADFTVYITTTTTNETTGETSTNRMPLDSSCYTVQGSTKQSNFSAEDKAGTSTDGWFEIIDANLSSVNSIRVIINDYEIPAGATVSVCFDGKVSGTAAAGANAWNNFGYTYSVGSDSSAISLEAMPLEVGVQVPSAPELEKKLVDLKGNAYTADKDAVFTFVVYAGEELMSNGSSYTSLTDLETALSAANRTYKEVTITVNEGDSNSGYVSLDWSAWTWTQGDTYTITEFLTGDTYAFKNWSAANESDGDKANGSSYTFVYNREKTLYLACENTYQLWSLELIKVDEDSYNEESGEYTTVLKGAVFALYTQDISKAVSDDNYAALSDRPEQTLMVGEGESAVTWYLYSVQTTKIDGKIDWTGLTEDSYYLVEVKAPDGYNLSFESAVVTRESNSKSITVKNEAGYVLPKSGGIGTGIFTLLGLMLCGGAAVMLWSRRRRA